MTAPERIEPSNSGAPAKPLLSVRGLTKLFPIKTGMFGKATGAVRAVDGVSFDVMPGETLGLVGESGCGKSTTGRMILRLIEPTAGSIEFDGINLVSLDRRAMRGLRRRIQVIFQDPFSSLNPRMTVGARRRVARDGRPQRRSSAPLSARVLGRPAAADRHRARARRGAEFHRL